MERYTQVKIIMIDEDVAKGMVELNQSLKDLEFKGHQVREVVPFLGSPRMWVITYQYDNRGTEDARGDIKEITA